MTTRLCPAVRQSAGSFTFRGAQTPLRSSRVRRTLVVVVPYDTTQKLSRPRIQGLLSAKHEQSHIIEFVVVTPCIPAVMPNQHGTP
jgi:hypothetical protein